MTTIVHILPKEAPSYLASKWIHFDMLVDHEEFQSLLESFKEPLYIFSTLGVANSGKHLIEKSALIDAYKRYVETLQEGRVPQDADFRFFFTACFTKTLSAVRAITLGNDKEIIIPYEPVLQMQIHRFTYTKNDAKFHSMSLGEKSISWGVRLSYPQLFQYPDTRKVEDALDEERFINATLYSAIRPWLRLHSLPTPFLVDGKRVNDPMRIGKKCLSWIHNHSELASRGLAIYGH